MLYFSLLPFTFLLLPSSEFSVSSVANYELISFKSAVDNALHWV